VFLSGNDAENCRENKKNDLAALTLTVHVKFASRHKCLCLYINRCTVTMHSSVNPKYQGKRDYSYFLDFEVLYLTLLHLPPHRFSAESEEAGIEPRIVATFV
jgi:hypothetical protein